MNALKYSFYFYYTYNIYHTSVWISPVIYLNLFLSEMFQEFYSYDYGGNVNDKIDTTKLNIQYSKHLHPSEINH